MGGWQNYGPFLGTLNIGWRTIIGIQKGTIMLTTTHMGFHVSLGGGGGVIYKGRREHAETSKLLSTPGVRSYGGC